MSKKKSTTIEPTTTLKDLAGVTRGLGNLTVAQIQALLKGDEPAKVLAKPVKPKAEPSAFYREVIEGGREARIARQSVNREAASWMREHGLVPSGAAWAAVKHGERSIKKLQAMNKADGLALPKKQEPKAEAAPVEAKRAKTAEPKVPAAEVVEPKAKGKRRKEKDTPAPLDAREESIQALVASGAFTEAEAEAAIG